MPPAFAEHRHWYDASLRSVSDTAEILYAYDTVAHGFSARLTPAEALALERRPGVLGVVAEARYELHTTRTPEFLGLDSTEGFIPQSNTTSDVVVGVLDTGVWPERKSYDDAGIGPVPASWKGACEEGKDFKAANVCNRKLVGARFFSKGESRSPRDNDGHGTHTSSTAAGSAVPNADLLGYAAGTARGMSTRARIAVYKVCWLGGCFGSDILAAMDKAIEDGCGVLSLSLGGGTSEYYRDNIAVGAFSAMAKGVVVSCSAGNAGPGASTLSNPNPTATIAFRGTKVGVRPSPVVAAFSSRGPSAITPGILKPDLMAPGVNILAAWTGSVGPTGQAADPRRTEFNIISGTSMSCPHVSGLAALLKGAHPDWSPGAIKSALMTTAYAAYPGDGGILDVATGRAATPFDFGAGHVDPPKALDPGLVYNVTTDDYLDFLCALNYTPLQIATLSRLTNYTCDRKKTYEVSDLNYPSFAVAFATASTTLKHTRTLTNVGAPGTYKATVSAPEDVKVVVEPTALTFAALGEKKNYTVTFSTSSQPSGSTAFGRLEWSDDQHVVGSPLAFSWT
ncbi:Peptidase inhibitor I9 [Musa troglodytarum]|uniref:Peptidase inhibitor I9 n=1 Tax=Musa troglodytarum TaxID=320322 RepID=A0A9E7KVX1_9LILI|nr:Peptidase inhibitor I9 [Musa troglodytarum]